MWHVSDVALISLGQGGWECGWSGIVYKAMEV